MRSFTTADLLADANKILDTWMANPSFTLGTITLADFQAAVTALQQADATVETRRTELTGLMDARDDHAAKVSDLVTRARSGFRAAFGANSAQYEQAGGTRASERKRPTRAAKAS